MQGRRGTPQIAITAEALFGQILRDARKETGLTQEDLAFQSGYHPTYIGQLERGKKSPSLRAILRFSTTIGVPASELLRRLEAVLNS